MMVGPKTLLVLLPTTSEVLHGGPSTTLEHQYPYLTQILRFRASDEAGGALKRSKMDDGLLVLVLMLVLQLPDTSLSAEHSLV